MDDRAINIPKEAATIFLLYGIGNFFSIISNTLITNKTEEMTTAVIVKIFLLGVTNLLMSSTLFSKKYNNKIILTSALLMIPSVFSLFFTVNTLLICHIIFCLLLTAFTYIMVKMPETPIREEIVKFRFIIPLFQALLFIISSTQLIQQLYYENSIISLIPSVLSLITSFLPIICYIFLVNWLADPYKK
ncbi:MAG: hypothetical protein E7529_03465 [Ruminococcaceae bacterium]|nr:hypothetical protein [Oscillospiraceae bacterium]